MIKSNMSFTGIFSLQPLEGKFNPYSEGWTTMKFITWDGHYIFKMNASASLVRIGQFIWEKQPLYQLLQPNGYYLAHSPLIVFQFDNRYRLVERTEVQKQEDERRIELNIGVPGLFQIDQ